MTEEEARLKTLCAALKELTAGQVRWVEQLVQVFGKEHRFWRLESSDLISDCLFKWSS